MEINKNRNYGIDLLRIVSMFMIAILHVLGQGVLTNTEHFGSRYEAAWFVETCSLCAVNCYALITGYVSVNAKKYRYSDLAYLWLRILLYSVIITVIGIFAFPGTTVKKDIIDSFFPVFSGRYWYVSSYFALYLFMPLLKKAIHAMTRRQYKAMLITGAIVFSIMPTLFRNDIFYLNLGYSFLWLCYMFCAGGYLKKYVDIKNFKTSKLIIGYFACIIGTLAFKYIYEMYYTNKLGEFTHALIAEAYNFPFILLSSIFLFLLFAKIKVRKTPAAVIEFVSPLAFSVYLIHCHPVIWREYISWNFIRLADNPLPLMIIKVILSAFAIFTICILIDIPREFIFNWLGIKNALRKFEEKHTKNIW